ncbi:MAG: hypothetical protein ACYDA3_10210 [Gaiellaceae bacterium]
MIQSSVAGWTDANGSPVDGCESALDPDPSGNTLSTAIAYIHVHSVGGSGSYSLQFHL